MLRSARARSIRFAAVLVAFVLVVPQFAGAREADRGSFEFETPLFGLAAKRGEIYVADAGQGVVKYDPGSGAGSLLAPLPGVTDIAPYRVDEMHAITGAPASMLFRVVDGDVRPIADIAAFEADVNPDGGEIDSNAFNVAGLRNKRALVADAAANALLHVGRKGRIDWVATLPDQRVPTRNAKRIVGCPDDPEPDFEFVCELPEKIPAQAVATSVAVGPDGAYYVGELKGFPAPRNRSRIWRIEAGTRHAECGSSPACTVVGRGFTSIVDLSFRHDGSLLVVEFDERSWFALEAGQATVGTVNSCDVASFQCEIVDRLPLPTGATSTRRDVFATMLALVPGEADVVPIG